MSTTSAPRSAVLDAIAEPDLTRLLDRSVPRRMAAGDTLAFAGETTGRMHLVTAGVLKLVGRDMEGNETILGLCVTGDVTESIPALDGGAQPYDYVAATDCTLVGFDGLMFAEVLSRNPIACMEMARALAARIRWLCDTAQERTSSYVPARLAGRLLDLADLLGRPRGTEIDVELPFPQRDLGGLAGMCRESACKTLRRWKAQGMVDYRGRKLRILRPDALYRVRCAGRAAEPFPSTGEGARRRSRSTGGT